MSPLSCHVCKPTSTDTSEMAMVICVSVFWFEHLKAMFFFFFFDIFNHLYFFFPWFGLAEAFKGKQTMFLTFTRLCVKSKRYLRRGVKAPRADPQTAA